MTIRQERKSDMFLRVRDFFNQNSADFPAGSIGAVLFAALLAIIAQIETLNAETVSAKSDVDQSIDIKGDAKDLVKDLLEDISDMAYSMAYEIIGLEEKFRIPPGLGVPNLIALARAFAADAVEYEAQFIANGLPATFIADLTAATDALEQAYIETDTDTQERIGKIAALVPLFKDGIITVNRLDPIVKMKYRGDAAKLSAWIYASHIERAPKPKSKPSE